MSKKLFLRVPDPFDSSTSARLERMGILRPDGQVNVETMRTFVQIFAGLFFGLKYAVYPTLGTVSTKAFISSVIGGLGSLPGAVVGALLLGVLETLITGFISSAWRDLFSFALMIVILIFRPYGLMGKSKSDKI